MSRVSKTIGAVAIQRRLARVVAVIAAAGLLAACHPLAHSEHGRDGRRVADAEHPLLTDPTRRHPIRVGASTAVLELPPLAGEPNGRLEAQLATMKFLRAYRDEAQGPLLVTLNGAPTNRVVARRLQAVQDVARANGIGRERMRFNHRAGNTAPGTVVTLAYHRIVAEGPECGDWSESVADDPERLPYPNFGCAQQRNLAAMVANPTDLAFPAPEALRQSDQRADQFKKFKEPQTTDAPKTLKAGAP